MPFYIASLLVFLLGLSVPAYAQTPTDAGALLQQIEQERQKIQQERELPALSDESAPEKESTQDELKVTVTSFRFEGNILLSDKKLNRVVKRYLDRPITYAQLQDAAAAVGEAYRKRGWAVRAFLPKQDIVNGVVIIQIIEARLGDVRVEEQSYHWPTERKIKATIAAQQKQSSVLNTRKMERGLLLLDDLPGVTASGRLQEGKAEGETDLVIKTAKEGWASGAAIVDNEGSRSTGQYRLHSFAQLLNPFGMGDLSSAYILYSDGLRFGRFEQTFPIGNNGWRVGANASIIDYEILPAEFESLDAKGQSTSLGAQASYPVIRSRQKSLNFNFNYDHKYFNNKAQAAISSKYMVDNYTAALRGNMVDQFAGGGNTYAALSIVLGTLDIGVLNTGEDPALDGRFHKMMYNVARQQTILPKLSLYAALSGQITPERKLDSSEKFYLGGPSGVRAYPVSEGSGVEGLISKTELRWRFLPNFQLSGFYDFGRVTNRGDIQSYNLEGGGLELAWQSKFGLSIKLTWAHRIGDNPNPTSSGDDQDGSLKKDRFWFQLSQQF